MQQTLELRRQIKTINESKLNYNVYFCVYHITNRVLICKIITQFEIEYLLMEIIFKNVYYLDHLTWYI